MIQETDKNGYHSSSSSGGESSEEFESAAESDHQEEFPEKFDLAKLKQRMEEGPASSSDDEDPDDNDDDLDEAGDEVEENEDEVPDEENQGSGWADAMAKVLNTGKNSTEKHLLLSKAKKDQKNTPTSTKPPTDRASVRQAK